MLWDRINVGGDMGFGVVIDLGNEMKWRALLELTEATGSVLTHEMVTGSRLMDGTSLETG